MEKLNGKLLRARIANLECGVAKAKAEAERLAGEVVEQWTEHRGFVQAEQRSLEQELAFFLAERERRRRLPQQSVKRGVRCVYVAPEPSAEPQEDLLTELTKKPALEPEKPATEVQEKEEEQKPDPVINKPVETFRISAEHEGVLRRKFRSAAYDNGKCNWEKLFHFYDRDNSVGIEVEEFKSMVRRDGKLTTRDVSDEDLGRFFKCLDPDSDGHLDLNEFINWLEEKPKGRSKA